MSTLLSPSGAWENALAVAVAATAALLMSLLLMLLLLLPPPPCYRHSGLHAHLAYTSYVTTMLPHRTHPPPGPHRHPCGPQWQQQQQLLLQQRTGTPPPSHPTHISSQSYYALPTLMLLPSPMVLYELMLIL